MAPPQMAAAPEQMEAAPPQMAAAGVKLPPPPHSWKRKASSGLSELFKRLSKWQGSGRSSVEGEEEEVVEEPESPRSFSMGLKKIMRLIVSAAVMRTSRMHLRSRHLPSPVSPVTARASAWTISRS